MGVVVCGRCFAIGFRRGRLCDSRISGQESALRRLCVVASRLQVVFRLVCRVPEPCHETAHYQRRCGDRDCRSTASEKSGRPLGFALRAPRWDGVGAARFSPGIVVGLWSHRVVVHPLKLLTFECVKAASTCLAVLAQW